MTIHPIDAVIQVATAHPAVIVLTSGVVLIQFAAIAIFLVVTEKWTWRSTFTVMAGGLVAAGLVFLASPIWATAGQPGAQLAVSDITTTIVRFAACDMAVSAVVLGGVLLVVDRRAWRSALKTLTVGAVTALIVATLPFWSQTGVVTGPVTSAFR